MEKAAPNKKLRTKILKLLPKAVSFGNLPFSPRRDNRPDANPQRFTTHQKKAFSGPLIPAEARRKSKNFESQQEPSSPKVSCMGKVKHKTKISEKKHVSSPKEFKPDSKKKKKIILRGARKPADGAEPAGESAPPLSQMRRFASSRDTFANFDWTTAQVAPEEDSDEDDGGIPFSAPILTAGGGGLNLEPKKEINLWKRRTMARPQSLELNIG